jgi:LEA14-like dessication related protein
MVSDAIAVTVRVTKTLEELGVPYFIGGSLASTLYGMVRTTQDSDIIAELRIEHIPLLMNELQIDFYMDDEMIADAIAHHSSFNIIHRESMFKVDVFIPRSRSFVKMQFSRARHETLSSDAKLVAKVASPEDTLLAKLEWYRMGGEVSERQWRDVLGVLKV